jgi:pyrroloquinoline-quinone synthase
MDFWRNLERLRSECNVLEHPFYQRWSAGELDASELAHYAGEYHHAVVALADASEHAARQVDPQADPELHRTLSEHACEETDHVALWEDFTNAVGGTVAHRPNPQTVACAREWAGDSTRPLVDSLVALYAIESGQPAISATKRAGLSCHYGVPAGPATAYFELHERLDVEHAQTARTLIEERLGDADHGLLLDQAERVLRANWILLDGVEQANQAA